MLIKEMFMAENPENYHIFDSHQESMAERGVDYKDQDFVVYSYNIHNVSVTYEIGAELTTGVD